MLSTLLLGAALAAEPPPTPATLTGGLSAVAAPGSYGGLGFGRAVLHFPMISIEAAGAEGVVSGEARHIGAIFVGARKYLPHDLYLRGGFYHQHEALLPDFRDAPGPVLLGVDEDINHRSGAQLALGWSYPFSRVIEGGIYERVRMGADLSVAALPSGVGPLVYGAFEFNVGFDVGKMSR
ncbi:MAG: hypothetical protein H6741_20050 [Alphaproteobacteria bacterium]|nr:hypothetical protein [Alphaproteobacteria bacterium]